MRNVYNKKDYSVFEKWYIGAVGFLASYNGRFFDGGYSGKRIIANGTDGGTYLLVYLNNTTNNISDYYDLLTQPADVLNTDLRNQWCNVDISSYFEENNVNI